MIASGLFFFSELQSWISSSLRESSEREGNIFFPVGFGNPDPAWCFTPCSGARGWRRDHAWSRRAGSPGTERVGRDPPVPEAALRALPAVPGCASQRGLTLPGERDAAELWRGTRWAPAGARLQPSLAVPLPPQPQQKQSERRRLLAGAVRAGGLGGKGGPGCFALARGQGRGAGARSERGLRGSVHSVDLLGEQPTRWPGPGVPVRPCPLPRAPTHPALPPSLPGAPLPRPRRGAALGFGSLIGAEPGAGGSALPSAPCSVSPAAAGAAERVGTGLPRGSGRTPSRRARCRGL